MFSARGLAGGLAPVHFRTYGIVKPRLTHTRPASCAEVECGPHRNGWATTLLAGSDDLAFVERVCRGDVDGIVRVYRAEPAEGGFVRLVFEAGQQCFAVSKHVVDVERPPLFVVRPGDRRVNPTGSTSVEIRVAEQSGRIHGRAEHWVEDFAEHLDTVRDNRERG